MKQPRNNSRDIDVKRRPESIDSGIESADLVAYQDALTRKGLEDMRSGRLLSHAAVLKRIRKKSEQRIDYLPNSRSRKQ